MKVLKRTPRTELAHKTILTRMSEVFEQVVEELGAPRHLVDEAMSQLALVSARVEFEKDEVDFQNVLPTDGAETVLSKWAKYLDTERIDRMEQALQMIRNADRPVEAATAPVPPRDAESK